MELNDYQKFAESTAVYPDSGEVGGLVYTILGLNGEAGECAEKVKKLIRDKSSIEGFKEAIKKELGDVLWYLAMASSELKFSLEEVAQTNIDKLSSRKDRGVLKGNGDER